MGAVLLILVILVILVCGFLTYRLWLSSAPEGGGPAAGDGPFTKEEVMQARLDLHRLERRAELTIAKHEQRREAAAVKQAIAEALEDERP